jgi:D-tagatose-1,6-bisphosphate aldolase subunit GatZ/KbaZ
LTFALRETAFLLQDMEEELVRSRADVTLSRFRETLDDAMVRNPAHWRSYYGGITPELDFARKYSLFDRARYYLTDERVADSLNLLISNLRSVEVPLPLISQFLPLQHDRIREGLLPIDPEAFIRDRLSDILAGYSYAVGNRQLPT